MNVRRTLLTAGSMLFLGCVSQAQEQHQKPHPLLQKLSPKIGAWEADITMFGQKIGSNTHTWKWAAGGNVLVYEGKVHVPSFNNYSSVLAVVSVEGDSMIRNTYFSDRDKEGAPRQYRCESALDDGKIVTPSPPWEVYDRLVDEFDEEGTKSVSAMKGEVALFKITNFRRIDGVDAMRPPIAAKESTVGPEPPPLESKESSRHTIHRDIVYSDLGDEKLLLDAYVPNSDGPHPAVMIAHGGGWFMGDKSGESGDSELATMLVDRGFAAFSIDYRLAPKHKFPAQLNDCRDALCWIYRNADKFRVNRKRIGAVGGSAGAHLVALLGVQGLQETHEEHEKPDRIAGDLLLDCVVGFGATCDLRDMSLDGDDLAYFLGGTRAEVPEAYRNASPAAFVNEHASPMLFVHGEKDDLVPIGSPRKMVALLQAVGVEAELVSLPGRGHVGPEQHLKSADGFFTKHLMP